MAISFELPAEVEAKLLESASDLNGMMKEAALVELYRRGELTERSLRLALGLSRLEVDALLKRHGIYLSMSADDVSAESKSLAESRDAGRR